MKTSSFAALALAALVLSGCAEMQLASHWAKKAAWPSGESKGAYKVGNPYKVGNVSYYPQEDFTLVETGIASWYGPGFHAEQTANGEKFDQHELTAAHRTLQMPSLVRVTNLENGRSVVLRVNDRGPFKHGRIIDVSQRAAELLGFISRGTARVRLEVLEKESRILAEAARRGEDTTRLTMEDLQKRPMPDSGVTTTAIAEPVQGAAPKAVTKVATRAVNSEDGLPESLRTPTITVEELQSNNVATAEPVALPEPTPSVQRTPTKGHMNDGRFMPDAVVSTAPVKPTGIFVQAGSFAVKENAEKLVTKLSSMSRAKMDEVVVKGKTYYRVKLGPISSVAEADRILSQVMKTGLDGAKVIKTKP